MRQMPETQPNPTSQSGVAEVLTGAKAIATFLGVSTRWLFLHLAHPRRGRKIPVKRFPDGGLVALRSELLDYLQQLPSHRTRR
jgi:hypothetical protein